MICLLLTACANEPARTSSAVIEDGASASPVIDGVVLDRSGDRVLAGQPEPVAPNSDQERVVDVDGMRVLDARFAGDAIVAVTAEHALVVIRGGVATELDTQTEAPLSVDGDIVAYARGDMPFFEIARADVVTGSITAITSDMAPAYSPAVDGDTIVFASTVSGAPRLYRYAHGQIAILDSERTPSSPRAPRLDGTRLTFEDELGTTTIEVPR